MTKKTDPALWCYLATPTIQKRICNGEPASVNELHQCAYTGQVQLRKKALVKLPSLKDKPFLFTARALEQCSGDTAAAYKIKVITGGSLCDITGGLGMDALAFHSAGMRVTYCERNPELVQLFGLNCQMNATTAIQTMAGDGIAFLKTQPNASYDWIFCDPDRRSHGQRHVALHKYQPNVIEYMPLLLQKTKQVCVKVSPALEISEAVKQLPSLAEVHIVSVDGSCREILLLCNQKGARGNPAIHIAVLSSKHTDGVCWTTRFNVIGAGGALSECQKFLMVPDAALVKSRCGDAYAVEHALHPLAKGQNLYTGNTVPIHFLGKAYSVVGQWPWKRKVVVNALEKQGVMACTLHVYWHKTDQAAARKVLRIPQASNTVHLFLCYGTGGKKMAVLVESVGVDTEA